MEKVNRKDVASILAERIMGWQLRKVVDQAFYCNEQGELERDIDDWNPLEDELDCAIVRDKGDGGVKCCGQEMRLAYDGGDKLKPILVCLLCERMEPIANPPPQEQAKLPGLDRGKQSVRVKQKEKDLVQSIRAALLARGYLVLRAGQYLAHMAGNDRGLPDLFVGRPGETLWLGMEVKLPGAARRAEQQHLADIGCIVIVESVQEAIEAAEREHDEQSGDT